MEPAESLISGIAAAKTDEWVDALRLLLKGFPESEGRAHVARLVELARRGKVTLEGLLVAVRDGLLAGVVWAQLQPGRAAVVWEPQLAPGGPTSLADALVAAADSWIVTRDVQVAQVLLNSPDAPPAKWFEKHGFAYLADLDYLACDVSRAPNTQTAADVSFEPYSPTNHTRLLELIDRSYEATLDCPALNGIRASEDVLTGYRATGEFHPSRWMIVRHEDQDVGCLLLTDHPDTNQWELVYMGLVLEARGRGLGVVITCHALDTAHRAGQNRLVLAVDRRNTPAQRMYAESGFFRWEAKSVWVKVYDAKNTSAHD